IGCFLVPLIAICTLIFLAYCQRLILIFTCLYRDQKRIKSSFTCNSGMEEQQDLPANIMLIPTVKKIPGSKFLPAEASAVVGQIPKWLMGE
ncbi:hypothetical protein, partial [Salinimicrobium oceani]|uniref:hypothetical protein n=1 Tax=Salinimicrobium oceani TaxID=2722702 RepID=UPI001ADD6A31